METQIINIAELQGNLREALDGYPGRGLIIGLNEQEQLVVGYFMTGRSTGSQNRLLVRDDQRGVIGTEVFDESIEKGDPELTIYDAMGATQLADEKLAFVVTNGRQTTDLLNTTERPEDFFEVLKGNWSHEPDDLQTPRISGMAVVDEVSGKKSYLMSVITPNHGQDDAESIWFSYEGDLDEPGVGYLITTYSGDTDNVTEFTGEPIRIPLSGSAKDIMSTIWGSLDFDIRVAAAVSVLDMEGEEFVLDSCIENRVVTIVGTNPVKLKYGENPQQKNAERYVTDQNDPWGVHQCRNVSMSAKLRGAVNEMDVSSLIGTYIDIMRNLRANSTTIPMLNEHQYIAIADKHNNPCGAAIAPTAELVIERMMMGDLQAVFGGVLLVDAVINENLAELLLTVGQPKDKKNFLNIVIAAGFTDEAKQRLSRVQLIELDALKEPHVYIDYPAPREFRQVRGGFIMQDPNTFVLDFEDERLQVRGTSELSDQQKIDTLIGVAVVKNSVSNSISLVKNGMLIGNGDGQQDRVTAATFSVLRAKNAKHDISGAVAVGDSFFPFSDGPQVLIDAGVDVIFSTSGSIRDHETIDLCAERGVISVMIPDKDGRLFAKHTG